MQVTMLLFLTLVYAGSPHITRISASSRFLCRELIHRFVTADRLQEGLKEPPLLQLFLLVLFRHNSGYVGHLLVLASEQEVEALTATPHSFYSL